MAARTPGPNPLIPPVVSGLEASRKLAAKRHRRKKRSGRVTSSVVVAIGIGVLAAGGFVGYTIYTEQRAADAAELKQRYAETQAERAGQTTEDLMEEYEDAPRWRGEPPPGMGDEVPTIEIIEP